MSRCKLLYIDWINNKHLPCSTGDHIQYPGRKKTLKTCIQTSN